MKKITPTLLVMLLALCINTASFSQVQQTWVQRYTTFGNEVPVSVKTYGNFVYVLGVLNQYATSANVILLKYNTAGNLIWSRVYNGPSNNEDRPVAMTIDPAGNIYVVGSSRVILPLASTGETFTLKYDAGGTLLWATRYLRPDTYPSELDAVAVDASGNVYVTGSTIQGEPFAYDFMTIKYNSAGVQQWMKTYNGTGGGTDMDTRIVLDAAGNVYIAGESLGQLRKGQTITQTFADVVIIKYTPAGRQSWVSRYNSPYNGIDRPEGFAIDAAGNLYTTGESSNLSNMDFLTLKFNSNGALQWAARHNRVGHDSGRGIVVNGAGDVYVTGLSDGGAGSYDYLTVKYNSAGAGLWSTAYNGPVNGMDIPNAISMDGFGNIYVTGESQGFSNYDFLTVRYGSNGGQQWAVRYNGPGNLVDKATAFAVVTPPGPFYQEANIYVAGGSDGVGTGQDIALIRYSQPLVIGLEATSQTSLSNSPNPFNESTSIDYELAAESDVSIQIIDVATAQEVESISLGKMSAGKHSYIVKGDNLRPGNYIYRISTESETGKKVESKMMIRQ